MRIKIRFVLIAVNLVIGSAVASTGGNVAEIDIVSTPDAVKRGAFVGVQTCSLCHSMKYLKYRDLAQIGLAVTEIDSLRINRSADDIISARLSPELANKAFGLVPPDLSVIAKANKNGAKHVYSILTSFHESAEGKIDNTYFPGIRMPDVLALSVEIDPARRAVLTERANNVSAFLEWAADPRAQERKSLGYWVIGYLVILTVLLYLIKNRVWARLK